MTDNASRHIQKQGLDAQVPPLLPTRLVDVELSTAIPDIAPVDDDTGIRYSKVQVLARLHTHPIGIVTIGLSGQTLDAETVASAIWAALADAIKRHLGEDGLNTDDLPTSGLPATTTPACLRARAQVLSDAPPINVVIATHNRGPALSRTLDSIRALEYPHFDAFVIDNAPGDDATANLLATQYHEMRYIREDRAGLAIAHNRGLQEVRAPIVAFTDDDVEVDRYWLAEIATAFALGEDVGCVTGMILPAELHTPAQHMIEQYGYHKGFERRVFDLKEHRPPGLLYPYSAGVFGSGANMAFRTTALRAVGGFDPALGAGSPAKGGDDLSGFYKMVSAGYKVVYEPAALLRHWHRREYEALRKQAYGYGVGLTAYLTSILYSHPVKVLDFALRAPMGVLHALRMRSSNPTQKDGYPAELARLERRGMLSGPAAYLRSLRRCAQWQRNRKDSAREITRGAHMRPQEVNDQ